MLHSCSLPALLYEHTNLIKTVFVALIRCIAPGVFGPVYGSTLFAISSSSNIPGSPSSNRGLASITSFSLLSHKSLSPITGSHLPPPLRPTFTFPIYLRTRSFPACPASPLSFSAYHDPPCRTPRRQTKFTSTSTFRVSSLRCHYDKCDK